MKKPESSNECDHGVVFDETIANGILGEWTPNDAVNFVMGNPRHTAVRERFPRLEGVCPKGCGFNGIAYASTEHYYAGDW